MLRLIYKVNGFFQVVVGRADVSEARRWCQENKVAYVMNRIDSEAEALDGLEEIWAKRR